MTESTASPTDRRLPVLGVGLALATSAVTVAALRGREAPTAEELKTAALRLLGAALPPRRALAVELWDGSELPATAPETARLILNSPASLGRMLRLPLDVAIGEAYLRGDFEIEGDVGSLAGLADELSLRLKPAALLALLRDARLLRRGAGEVPSPSSVRLEGQQHTRARDREAVSYHYDVSNEFYSLWLDRRMVYSCGYFPGGDETLDRAQEAKLELICRKLRLMPGERLLDIGCGWGGLAIYAAQQYGVRVLGITLSDAQLQEGRSRVRAAGVADLVRLERLDYRDLKGGEFDGAFDKVASVGMAEHVGRRNMRAYFEAAYRALRPGGLMLNHAIADGLG
ncbi:MAG: class I SAM-dependent methyltransferase, partial [Deinococcus sp.]